MTPEHRALIDRIRSSAAAVRRAVDHLPADRLLRGTAGEWSPHETQTHLRDAVVFVHGLRIRRLFYEADPVFADFDEEAYRRGSLVRDEATRDLLETIIGEHEQIARLLATLPDAQWGRPGRHPSLGTMSVELLARRAAEHAEEHAAQIAAAGAAPA